MGMQDLERNEIQSNLLKS